MVFYINGVGDPVGDEDPFDFFSYFGVGEDTTVFQVSLQIFQVGIWGGEGLCRLEFPSSHGEGDMRPLLFCFDEDEFN